MPSSAKDIMSQKMEDATHCEPTAKTQKNSMKSKTAAPNAAKTSAEHTHLGLDMPPLAANKAAKGPRIQLDQQPYVAGKMKPKKTKRNVAIGAAVLGGLAAGAYALYKKGENPTDATKAKGVGNTLAALLPKGQAVTIRKRQEVDAKSSVVYAEWRKLENLPNILTHLKEVKVLDEKRSLWTAKGPAGTEVNWYANITEDEPGRAISWKAEEKADVPNSGRILFSETPKGKTLIEVTLTYQPPAGSVGQAIAAAFGENPEKQITDDLKNFKQSIESRITA